MNFDFNEARKNNSDEEILNSIKNKSKEFGYDFNGAINAGFGATEIIDALDVIQKQRKQNQQIEKNNDNKESNYSDSEISKLFEDIKTNPEKQDFNQTSIYKPDSNDFINRENFSKSVNSLIQDIGGIKTGDQEIKINIQEQNLTDQNSIQNPLQTQNTQNKSELREDPKYKGVFYNDKEDTRLSDGFSWQGALNTLTQARDDYTYENKIDKAIYDRLRQNVRIKLQNKAPIEDYTNAEKEILLKDYHIDNKVLNTLNSILPTALTSQSDALVNVSKIAGEKEQEIVNKNLNDLSEEDKEYLKDKAGLLNSTWNKIFHDNDKTIEEEYDKLRGGKEIQEASAAVERLKNFSLDKNLLFTITSGDKMKEEAKKRFEDDLMKTAEFLGFDNVAIDRVNENIFFEKDNKLYKLNDGFFDNFETIMGANTFSIGGGIAGAIKGAKSGKDPKSKIIKGAAYGALGSLSGGGMDYLLQSYRDNKEARFDELVTHATQEGLLSLAGDGVALALKPLTLSVKPAMKLVQKTPIVNYFTQDLPEQNINAAKKVVNNWFEPKNKEEAKKIIDEMGGGIELENGNFYGNKLVDWVKNKFGENSKTAKIANHLNNFFMMPNARERQKEVFNLLRASDNGAAILAEVARSDARAGEKLKEIFNYSTQNLKMQLGNLNLNKDEIADILKSYESGTSSDYARMEKVLSAAYKNEKVRLDHHVYEKVKNKLMDENLAGEEIDSFLKDLKNSLFDRELSFKQLNNARKNLNSLFSQRQNYGEHLKRVLANELRQTIQGGIEEIFSKNPKMFEKANKLYNDTLEEYGILKELQKMDFFKSVKDPEVNVKEIADKVLNAAKSQGDVLAKFTSKLDKKNQARIELNILDEIFNQSLYKNGKLEVFDSKDFFKRLENAKFHSKEANDYIQIAKNFDRVFGNDANIAGSIGGYKGVKLGTGLATSIEGAAKYQHTRILLNSIIRNLPNPLGLFNDLAGNAALRFHVLNALRKSQTSQEFTNLMENEVKKMPFISSSRTNLSEFLKDFKEFKNKVLEAEVIEDDPIYAKELNNPIIHHNRQVEFKGADSIDNFRQQAGSQNLIKSDLENSNTNPQMNQDLVHQSLKDIDFIDNKGEVRTLSKETQKEWLDTFNLKSLDESYIPKHNDGIKQALKGKEIKLTKGSLLKLVVRNRQKYIAYIKETLDNPDFILKDKNELIFAKNFNQETYFTSIGKNYDTHFTVVSNAPKKQNTIKNKLNNGAKILYQSSKFENLRYNQTFTDERLIANKTDGKNFNQDLINQSLNKFNIFDLYRSKNDFLDIKKLEKSLEKYKESKPQEIKYKELKRGYILDDLLNVDEDVSYAVVNKDDLKPSLTRSLSQFRNKHSNSTISDIRNSFNEREHFKESSNFDGIPTITKDGLVIAGNHRTTAIKDLKGENLARYIKQAKRVYGEDVFKGFDENKAMIVRILDKNDDDTIIRLSKLSNDGRLSDESEKLQALGAKYKEKLSKIENAKLNSEKELANFLGSKDVLESRRALLDHLMPDIYNALLAWERRSGGDSEFSKILSDNALNFLHLKQALNENKVFKDNGNDFFSLFKRAIESMNQSNAYKNSQELYEMLKKYAEPSLNFEKEFIPNDKDLQADILAFIVKYNDTLTNPSEALGLKIQKAIDFIRDNDSFSLFDEIKLSNYDVLNQMLNPNIATSSKYQELLSKAIDNVSRSNPEIIIKDKNLLRKLDSNVKDEDILQKYDDYLGENKKFNLDYLGEMDLDPIHYNLTREFIINAKKDTLKGIKHDIPERMRKQIEEKLNIKPIKEFGVNYAEYYHDGSRAIEKLILEKQGQVAGAFYRKELGDIDLVWGEITDKANHKGYGLAHIRDKHPMFNVKLIDYIIENGELVKRKGSDDSYNIVYDNLTLGVNKGFDKKGENNWIVTAFDNGEKAKTARTGDFTKEVNSLSLNSKDNFNTNSAGSQTQELDKSDIISQQGVKNGSKIQEFNDSTLHKIPQEGTKIQGIHSAVLRRDEQSIQEAFQEDLQGIQGSRNIGKISDEHGNRDGLHQGKNGRAWNERGGDQRSELDIHEQGLLQGGRGNRVDEATNLQDVSVKDSYKSKNNFSGASSPKEEVLFKNYRLDKNEIENHTPYTRYNDNINALKLLKELENNDLIPNDDQKEILSKYHGWGGLAQYAFNNEARVNELKEILSESEFDSARKSVLSSFYTPNKIINAMVDTISKIGFKEAKTLEPAAGIGKFLGFLPKDYKAYAVEIDSISSRIAKQLYPNAKIDHNAFEKSIFNNFDLVIGNPPFGSMKILDTSDKNLNGMNVHNYFIAKGLDKLRENGLLAYIVSSSFLDAKNIAAKKIIASKGEFLGAVRLPNNVFKDTQVTSDLIFFRKYAKDDVKKDDWIGVSPINIDGKEFLISDYFAKNPKNVLGEFRSGEGLYGNDNFGVYLEDENILNRALENLNDYVDFENANFAKVKSMDDINDSFIKTETTKAEIGSFVVKDDRVYRVNEDGLSEVKMHELLDLDKDVIIDAKTKPLLQSQIKAMKKLAPQVEELRSSLKSLQQAELRADVTDADLVKLRFDLNKKYDSLIKQSGNINGSKFKSLYRYDGAFHKLAALEKEIKEKKNGKDIKKYEKSDIFFKRVLYPYAKPEIANSLEDAINISLNENNTLNYDRILGLLNKNDKDELQKELLENEIIYKDENGSFIEKNEFLSGDVKTKYEKLKNEGDLNDEYIKKSLDALERVIPKDIDAVDIAFDIGSAWLPKHFLHDFVSKRLSSNIENIVFSNLTGWNIKISKSILADNDFGVVGKFKSIDAQDVLNAALNDSSINMNKKIYDNGKLVQELKDPEANEAVAKAISAIKTEFVDFIQDDPKLAQELQKTYNDIFNRKVLRKYNGDHLKLIGSNANIKLRSHQKNAIYRILTNNNTLIDHTVGTGKTWTMVAAAMEMRRLGISKKPLFAVPKSIVAQFAKEFSMLYPNANILAMSKFDANNRKRILSSIATNDYDAVIISHDNLKGIDINPENEAKFLEEELRETKNALEVMKKENGEKVNIKNLEKTIATLEGKLQYLSDIKKDNIYFEDLGIDALFIDEAHKHKNLRFFTKLCNIKGLGNPMGSQIANDLYNKTRLLQRNNAKIVFATGTPIVNSIAEIFTLQRYLDSQTLKQQGTLYFDQWVKKNGTIESAYELNAVNKYVLKTRLSSIKNIPELQTEFRSFADVVDNDQVKDFLMKEGRDPNFLPKIEMKLIAAKISPEQKEFMKSLISRAEKLEKSSKSDRPKVLSKNGVPIDDSAILIMNDARKASLDMRLIDPSIKDFKDSKINLAVEDIYQNYVKFSQDKGTQIVFCDLSTPKTKNKIDPSKLEELKIKAENGDEKALKEYEEMLSIMENQNFSVYDDMRDKLITKGIKSNEIAFIHDYDSDTKRIKLFEAVNRGDVRVLFGSTQKMGAGVNVQERLVALHNLDITWTPADMEQRIGRIERQGNILARKNPNFKALVRNYSTKEMLDARLWEILEQKMKFIKQLQKGELTGRVAEDISGESTIPADEFKAISTGNPLVIEEQKIKREIAGLVAEQKSFLRKQNARALQIENLEKSIANTPDKIKTYESILKQIKPKGKVVVKGISYDGKSKSKALDKMGELIKSSSSLVHFATYRGFDFTAFKINGRVSLNLLFGDRNFELPDSMKINEFVSGGLLTRMDNYLDKFLPNRIKILKDEKLANQKELATLKSVKIKTFDKEKELKQLKERLDEVMKLNMASKEEINE